MTLCFVVALLGVFIPSRKEVKDLDKETVGGMQVVYVDLYHKGGEIDSEWSPNMQKRDSYYESVFVAHFDVLLPTSEEVTKPGCIFGGWYTNREFLGEPITEIKSIENDTNLYAKWITLDMEKKASWHQVNGKKFDENGNPYVKIDITFDCSNLDFSLYKGKKIDIEDYIPAEFSVLEDTIKIKDSSCVDYGESFDSANNIVSAYWDNESAPDKTPSDYELSFVMTLNLKILSMS
jgi:hypothetical protein